MLQAIYTVLKVAGDYYTNIAAFFDLAKAQEYTIWWNERNEGTAYISYCMLNPPMIEGSADRSFFNQPDLLVRPIIYRGNKWCECNKPM
jgi:hypothetical protein